MKTVEDIETKVHGGLEQDLRIPHTFWVLVRAPRPREANRTLPAGTAHRVVNRRLGCERQGEHAVVPHELLVTRNTVGVRGEYEVEILGHIDEHFEVGRVFLVPEHGGQLLLAAPRKQI